MVAPGVVGVIEYRVEHLYGDSLNLLSAKGGIPWEFIFLKKEPKLRSI